ncbi:MAG: tetratricopeptide repeat protein [Anaerolineae bacterium]|nr:tetratricopeptide repeat protein [Anaerolineae bacterium]
MATSVYADLYHRLLEHKTYDSGIEVFTAIIEQIPDDIEGYIYRAQLYARQQKLKEALADIRRAIQLSPQSGYAHYVHGDIRRRMVDFKEAVVAYTRAITYGYVDAYNNRGVILIKLRKYRAAYGDFTRAIHHNPQLSRAYHNRGLVRCHLKDYKGAIRDLTIAINKDSTYRRSYVVLGCAYSAIGKKEQARNALCFFVKKGGVLSAEIQNMLHDMGGCRETSSQSVRGNPLSSVGERGDMPDTKPLQSFPESSV